MLLATTAAGAHCWLRLRSLPTVTPRTSSAELPWAGRPQLGSLQEDSFHLMYWFEELFLLWKRDFNNLLTHHNSIIHDTEAHRNLAISPQFTSLWMHILVPASKYMVVNGFLFQSFSKGFWTNLLLQLVLLLYLTFFNNSSIWATHLL